MVKQQQPKSEEAAAVANLQQDDGQIGNDEEGEVMLTIVPNEDGEMVAVPVRVQQSTGDDGENEEGTTMEVHMEGENAEYQVRITRELHC